MTSGEKPPPSDPPDTGTRSVRFGNFILVRRLAVGGMSEVYLARPFGASSPDQLLVIKRLLPELAENPTSTNTFLTEATLQSRVRHPNVVGVLESGFVEGEPFIALEYVHGADLYRLLRRCRDEPRPLAKDLGIHIARRLCAALGAVHGLADPDGTSLGLVHRDVSPSNVFLSMRGDAKLGDFGIATALRGGRPPRSAALKGKHDYLAPEQVEGLHFDHRADLFSLAVLLSEMLIGRPVFEGGSQLAVLIAIRDARIDSVKRAGLGGPLTAVLEKALARDPADRFQSARELSEALAPFEQRPAAALRAELAELTKWAHDSGSLAKRLEGVILETRRSGQMRAPAKATAEAGPPPAAPPMAPPPIPSGALPDNTPLALGVRRRGASRARTVPFTKLIELIATGQLNPEDEVELGGGFRPLGRISMLSRYFPVPTSATTKRLHGPGVPDYAAELSATPMLDVFAWVLRNATDGALFAEREQGSTTARKELYFSGGQLMLTISNEPSELLGEHLVRKGIIDRGELEMALIAMHNHEIPLGDTLVTLGLVDAMDMFQAIRAQGLERTLDLFGWSQGHVAFYKGVTPPRKAFPLHLEIPLLMLEGTFVRKDAVTTTWARHMKDRYAVSGSAPFAREPVWPEAITSLLTCLGGGRSVLDACEQRTRADDASSTETLCAMEVALACGLIEGCDGAAAGRGE